MVTGQTGLNKLLFQANIAPSSLCKCGAGEEGNLHFLIECERFCTQRQSIFGFPELRKEDLKAVKLKQVLQYIKASGKMEEMGRDDQFDHMEGWPEGAEEQ